MGIFKKIIKSISGNQEEPVMTPRSLPATSNSNKSKANKKKRSTLPTSSHEKVSSSSPSAISRQNKPPSAPFPFVSNTALEDKTAFLDEVVEAFDRAFEAACPDQVDQPVSDSVTAGQDEAAVQELFRDIAAAYALPLKNFVFELQRHTATKDSIEFCRPILRSISSAAGSVNLPETVKRMTEFDTALSLGQTSSDHLLNGEIRQQILASYEVLAEVLPEAFRMDSEAQQRGDIIIQSLLPQVTGIGCVTFDKLYQAGLGSLDMLFLANKEDLAAVTAIAPGLCESICNKVQQYRAEAEARARPAAQSGYRSRLIELVNELRDQMNTEKTKREAGSETPAVDARRRRLRRRQQCFLEINVTLAELGELGLINQLKKLSFNQRLQVLDEYLNKS
jgi:hypothetical protein